MGSFTLFKPNNFFKSSSQFKLLQLNKSVLDAFVTSVEYSLPFVSRYNKYVSIVPNKASPFSTLFLILSSLSKSHFNFDAGKYVSNFNPVLEFINFIFLSSLDNSLHNF